MTSALASRVSGGMHEFTRYLLQMLVVAAGWIGFVIVSALAVKAGRRVRRRVRRLRRRRAARRKARTWRLTLIVRPDEGGEQLHPSIQIQGSEVPKRSKVRLEVADDDGRIRCASERRLPASAQGTELPLPTVTPPAGVAASRMLAWDWRVTIGHPPRRRVSWTYRLGRVRGLNPEAELQIGGSGGGRRSPPPEAGARRVRAMLTSAARIRSGLDRARGLR